MARSSPYRRPELRDAYPEGCRGRARLGSAQSIMTSILRPALRLTRTLPARSTCYAAPHLPSTHSIPRLSQTPGASTSQRTLATHASDRQPSHPALLVRHPTQEELDAEEIDAEAVGPEKAKLELTDRAAEVHTRLSSRESMLTSPSSNYEPSLPARRMRKPHYESL